MNDWIAILSVFFSIFDHSDIAAFAGDPFFWNSLLKTLLVKKIIVAGPSRGHFLQYDGLVHRICALVVQLYGTQRPTRPGNSHGGIRLSALFAVVMYS